MNSYENYSKIAKRNDNPSTLRFPTNTGNHPFLIRAISENKHDITQKRSDAQKDYFQAIKVHDS